MDRPGGRWVRAWRTQLQRSMWPLSVVVRGVDGEHPAEVLFAEDQHSVGEFGADGQHEYERRRRRRGDDPKWVGAVLGPDRVDELAGWIGHFRAGRWGEEGVEPNTFCARKSAHRGADGAHQHGQLVDPPPPHQPLPQPGDVGWGVGANRVDQSVLPIDCGGEAGWNEEGMHGSLRAAAGMTHRGPPGVDRDVSSRPWAEFRAATPLPAARRPARSGTPRSRSFSAAARPGTMTPTWTSRSPRCYSIRRVAWRPTYSCRCAAHRPLPDRQRRRGLPPGIYLHHPQLDWSSSSAQARSASRPPASQRASSTRATRT